jgi:uncharacterized protein YggU (UPF0235/DUF167 family)
MYVHARVRADQKNESFATVSKTHFSITVREKAERNDANRRVIALVAEHFQVPVGKVRIVNGHHSPSKLLSVDVDA